MNAGPSAGNNAVFQLVPFADDASNSLNRLAAQSAWDTTWGTLPNDSFSKGTFYIYSSLTLVPEPSTALLLGLGFAGLGVLRRR